MPFLKLNIDKRNARARRLRKSYQKKIKFRLSLYFDIYTAEMYQIDSIEYKPSFYLLLGSKRTSLNLILYEMKRKCTLFTTMQKWIPIKVLFA